MEHYFSDSPSSEHDIVIVHEAFGSERFQFQTDSGVFSKGKMDKGTRLLLEALPALSNERVLDLGCGWGAIGIILSKLYPMADVHLSDVNPRAITLSRRNAKKNGVKVEVHNSDMFKNLELSFDLIATNPPIRAGKKVIYEMIEKGHEHLNVGGSFYSVVRTKQGANSYSIELERVFHNVDIVMRGGGYKVFRAVREDERSTCEKGTRGDDT